MFRTFRIFPIRTLLSPPYCTAFPDLVQVKLVDRGQLKIGRLFSLPIRAVVGGAVQGTVLLSTAGNGCVLGRLVPAALGLDGRVDLPQPECVVFRPCDLQEGIND